MSNLYSKDQKVAFDKLFSKPSSLYGDTPFWAWNCKLDRAQLLRQIDNFQKMGMGGFHMHPRTGLATPYLSDEFMELVKACVAEAKKRGMKAHLYDEDRWPSGFAGGLVSKDKEFRARRLIISSDNVDPDPEHHDRTLLKIWALKFDSDNRLVSSRYLKSAKELKKGEVIRYILRELDQNSEWFNFLGYVDTLNPKAIERFVAITHKRYFEAVGGEFGKTVPSIFTDEPQFSEKRMPRFADSTEEIRLPYTESLPDVFRQRSGVDFWKALGEIVFERHDGKYSRLRYYFHDTVAEMFAVAFSDTVGNWCKAHHLALSGHLMEEPTLESQTHSLGEAMRSYRSFGMPGIDMLCDMREYSTAKQAQSASRQLGLGGVLSELDGVTDWDFDFPGHKSHGDWQAALGVTVRVPHLAWVSMEGEAKHDYPASISYQSPWHDQYKLVSGHFSRVNVAMTRGKAVSRVGVLHPVESYWLIYGPQDQTARARSKAENAFQSLLNDLIFGLIDFDYISESLLPGEFSASKDKKFHVGEMAYDVVIVPPTITLRSTTLDALEKFRKAGGRIIFAGDVATMCDVQDSDRAAKLAAECEKIAFERNSVLDALESVRVLSVRNRESGYEAEKLLYQMREEGDTRYLFIANAADRHSRIFRARIELAGEYKLTLLDTFTGKKTPVGASYVNGKTQLDYDFYPAGHLLLELVPGRDEKSARIAQPVCDCNAQEAALAADFPGAFDVKLDEPNVLLLDQAEYRVVGDKTFAPREELMRVSAKLLFRLTDGKSLGHDAQPWSWPEPPKHLGRVELKFTFASETAVSGALLALEKPEKTEICFDGKSVASKVVGFWTDEAIRTVKLPRFGKGTHTITLAFDYDETSTCQWCYVLGDFGVEVRGREAAITAPVRKLYWGNIVNQGLPFYGGNVTYCCQAVLPKKGAYAVRIPSLCSGEGGGQVSFSDGERQPFAAFGGTMVGVKVDGGAELPLAFAPYQAELGVLAKGKHDIEFTLYGNRGNCFGGVHLTCNIFWAGQNNWTRIGDAFSYEYRLQQLGILTSPRILGE